MSEPCKDSVRENASIEPGEEKWERVRARLESLYGPGAAPGLATALREMVGRASGASGGGVAHPAARQRWSQEDALLISYGDTLRDEGGGDEAPPGGGGRPPLQVLREFLDGHVGDAVSFVHVLPFFPYSSDDGFSVLDFRQVRDDLGDWGDVRALGARYRVVFDAVINHVSARSRYVEGFLAGDPEFAGFAIEVDDPNEDTSRVVRPRDLPLLHEFEKSDGSTAWLWTTFSRDQVDLNFKNPRVLLEVLDTLLFYSGQGAAMLRLDAIPYLWKKRGTSCIHLKETHTIIKLMRDVFDLAAPGVLLLSETNVPHHENISYFGEGGDEAQMIYNFTLPPLVLHSMTTGDASRLTRWAQDLGPYWRGCTWLNFTASHDGIGMRPTEGVLDDGERQRLVELATAHGGDVSYKRNADGSLTPYELNITYFDAVNNPNTDTAPEVEAARFLVSQAVPMVLKGVPGVYIHSLLGSRNHYAGVVETDRARSINREHLSLPAVVEALSDPLSMRSRVFRGVLRMLQARRSRRAFDPESDQRVLDLGPGVFAVLRRCRDTGARVLALHNVTAKRVRIDRRRVPVRGPLTDIITGQLVWLGDVGEDIVLLPYQVAWLA